MDSTQPLLQNSNEFRIQETQLENYSKFEAQVLDHLAREGIGAGSKYSEQSHLRCVFSSCVNENISEKKKANPFEMWRKWYDWRKSLETTNLSEAVLAEIDSGKVFWHMSDKQNHPCLVIKSGGPRASKNLSPDDKMRYLIFILDQGLEEAKRRGCEKICAIWDRGGCSRKEKKFCCGGNSSENKSSGCCSTSTSKEQTSAGNCCSKDAAVCSVCPKQMTNKEKNKCSGSCSKEGRSASKQLCSMMRYNYMDRLDKIYIINMGWFKRMLYGITKPLINKKTGEKIVVISKLDELKNYFSESCLLKEHGGTSEENEAKDALIVKL